jgi:lysozyme family protein
MQTNWPNCLAFTLGAEGGFVDNPTDPGGATNMGITAVTLANYLGRPVNSADVQAMTQDTAAAIYQLNYWRPIQGNVMPNGVDLMLFDWGVNAGPATPNVRLQRILNVAQDGVIGPETIAAVNVHDPRWLITLLGYARNAYYTDLNEPEFQRGWLSRSAACRTAALAMVTV